MARPSYKITPEILVKVETMASRGLTNDQIALSLGWHPDTLYAKKRAFSEFSDAIKRGKAKGLLQISNKMFEDALAGNTTAQIFYLKTRDKKNWNDGILGDLEVGAPMSITFGVAAPVGEVKTTNAHNDDDPDSANE